MEKDEFKVYPREMRPQIEAVHAAICGSPDGRVPGLAEQIRDTQAAFANHVADAGARAERLGKLEGDMYGNGKPGLRADMRKIKNDFRALKWVGVVVLAAFLTSAGKSLWKTTYGQTGSAVTAAEAEGKPEIRLKRD